MDTARIEKIVSWMSSLAVLIGIALVILQLRQNEKLTQLQITTDIYISQKQFESTIMGENFSETLAKVHLSPTELSDAELIQYDSYAYTVIDSTRNFKLLFDAGLIKEDWEVTVQANACYFFNNPVGKAYLNSPALARDEVVTHYLARLLSCKADENYLTYMRDHIEK